MLHTRGMTVTDVVTIRGLDHSHGQTHALRGIDLTVGAHECVALLGQTGCDVRGWSLPAARRVAR